MELSIIADITVMWFIMFAFWIHYCRQIGQFFVMFATKFKRNEVHPVGTVLAKLIEIELENIENMCIKCRRRISEHPATGRFHTIVLYGPECAWDPDHEWKEYVVNVLKSSGYNIADFGYNEYSRPME